MEKLEKIGRKRQQPPSLIPVTLCKPMKLCSLFSIPSNNLSSLLSSPVIISCYTIAFIMLPDIDIKKNDNRFSIFIIFANKPIRPMFSRLTERCAICNKSH